MGSEFSRQMAGLHLAGPAISSKEKRSDDLFNEVLVIVLQFYGFLGNPFSGEAFFANHLS